MGILLSADDHPCKRALLDLMTLRPRPARRAGLRWVASLVADIYHRSGSMEDPTSYDLPTLAEPTISSDRLATDSVAHKRGREGLHLGTLLLYMEG